ncbi:MAG: hypothetical protein RJA07_923 [Bacteroidota bacterium]|jgi:CheY-like chemotaxis protein
MKEIPGLHCILLIDDDEATNYFNQILIKKTNIDVKVQFATNGQEGLDFLTCKGKFAANLEFPQPGLIFLDINMPIMNGWEFLDEYVKLPDEQKAKIVLSMLTTSMNPDDEERAKTNTNTNGFIRKPITLSIIEGIVEKYFPCN